MLKLLYSFEYTLQLDTGR